MKRRRIKPRSQAAWDDDARRTEVREAVLWRDGRRCVVAPYAGALIIDPCADPDDLDGCGSFVVPECRGGLEFGHRRKASAGGAYIEANGNTTCRGHNRWVEDHPDDARALGGETPWWLVVRECDDEWEQLGRKAAGVR